jgi:uncharacterized protein YndB with AHSA1/START domain
MPLENVTVTRLLSARRERVFEAWTRPDLMARWFFPGSGWQAQISSELRVGGRWQVVMRDAEGGQHLQFGEYREIVPPTRLVFTWSCPDLGVDSSVVTVELRDRAGQTELQLTHELPADPQVLRGHEEGWLGCLSNLENWLNHHAQGD